MRNRLYDCICVFIVLEILQSSICYAKIVNDTCRTKREISVAETSQLKGDTSYAKEIQGINLERDGGDDDDIEEDNTYQDDTKEKHQISRKAADSVISTDFHQSNAEKSIDRDKISNYSNLTHSNEGSDYPEEIDEEATKRERNKNEETSNLVRLPHYVNGDLDKYIDQNGRSSLYDDYEAKDVAKRGILSGSEDYEEMKDDSPEILEDMVAMQEQESINEAEKREMRKDVRMKRDRAVSETLDKSTLNPDNPAKLEESKIATKNPYSREVSRIETSKSLNEVSAPNDASKIKGFGSNEMILKLSGSSKDQEPTSIIASSKKGESSAEYEKRVEEEIQRKIDLIKEEIQRDIEAQQRIRDIEENNARFGELQDQEHEDEERQNFEGKPIEKRQTIAKRSIRKVAKNAAAFSKRNGKKQSLKREQHKKRQQRSSKTGKSDILKENEDLKRRFVANYNKSFKQVPSKELFKKKRERVRQIFLVNNDQHQTKKRQSRNYTSPSGRTAVRSENELFMNADLNSHLHRDNRMLEVSMPVGHEDENNERQRSPTAEHSDSSVSLIGSSQELSPRLEKEYREVFGGLQSEPGSALARYKRIKRVLAGPDAKI